MRLFGNCTKFQCEKCQQVYAARLPSYRTGSVHYPGAPGPAPTQQQPNTDDGKKRKQGRNANETKQSKKRKQDSEEEISEEDEEEDEWEVESDSESVDETETSEMVAAGELCAVCLDGGFLLQCDGCYHGFHLECCYPPIRKEQIPDGDWYCAVCAAIKKNYANQWGIDQVVLARVKGHWWPATVSSECLVLILAQVAMLQAIVDPELKAELHKEASKKLQKSPQAFQGVCLLRFLGDESYGYVSQADLRPYTPEDNPEGGLSISDLLVHWWLR